MKEEKKSVLNYKCDSGVHLIFKFGKNMIWQMFGIFFSTYISRI